MTLHQYEKYKNSSTVVNHFLRFITVLRHERILRNKEQMKLIFLNFYNTIYDGILVMNMRN